MQPWEIAVTEFLKDWQVNPEVIGAMVCGSYVTGFPSKRSDIDVHIILADEVDWRERGNKICNGYLIEYFANPPRQIRGYFDEDFHGHTSMSMVQFMTGRIILDTTGVMRELKAEAAEWMSKKHDALDDTLIETKKYAIWDDLDNLQDCYEQKRTDFHFNYHHSLFRLFAAYCNFLNLENIPYYQIYSYLSDPTYLSKYVKNRFLDDEFKQAFINALGEVDSQKMMERYEQLSQHVLSKMGGFEIDGWKMRTAVDFFL